MADPEQIYQEVLTEEQGKGSSPAVAEGRAKAARQRAHEGSPHPKEPKWWPGSQPHFEGGGGAAPAAEVEEAAPEPEAEAPPEPAEPAAAVATPEPQVPATPEPAPSNLEAPAAQQEPAVAAVATAPAPAAVAATSEARAPGVSPGTPTGNRLRPEDSVGTDSQFDAQQAVYQRRKLLEELVATGVPAVSVERPQERRGGGLLVVVYLLIVALAIGFVVANTDELQGSEPAAAEEGGGAEGGAAGGGLTVTASGVAFDTDTLNIPAEGAELTFNNEDTVQHNIGIYSEEGGEELFKGDLLNGGQSTTYSIPSLEKGEHYFQCDVHPSMNGTVVVK